MMGMFDAETTLEKTVDKLNVLPATRKTSDVSPAATKGLPPGAYNPKKDKEYNEMVKPIPKVKSKEVSAVMTDRIESSIMSAANGLQGVYGVGED